MVINGLQSEHGVLSPFVTGRMFVNMVRTVRRILLLSHLACNEMQASARTCGRRAADSMIENVG